MTRERERESGQRWEAKKWRGKGTQEDGLKRPFPTRYKLPNISLECLRDNTELNHDYSSEPWSSFRSLDVNMWLQIWLWNSFDIPTVGLMEWLRFEDVAQRLSVFSGMTVVRNQISTFISFMVQLLECVFIDRVSHRDYFAIDKTIVTEVLRTLKTLG